MHWSYYHANDHIIMRNWSFNYRISHSHIINMQRSHNLTTGHTIMQSITYDPPTYQLGHIILLTGHFSIHTIIQPVKQSYNQSPIQSNDLMQQP